MNNQKQACNVQKKQKKSELGTTSKSILEDITTLYLAQALITKQINKSQFVKEVRDFELTNN